MLQINPYVKKFYNRDYIFNVSNMSWGEFTQLLRQLKITGDSFSVHTKLDKSQQGSRIYIAHEGKTMGYLVITDIQSGSKNDVLLVASPYICTCPQFPVSLKFTLKYFYSIPNFN